MGEACKYDRLSLGYLLPPPPHLQQVSRYGAPTPTRTWFIYITLHYSGDRDVDTVAHPMALPFPPVVSFCPPPGDAVPTMGEEGAAGGTQRTNNDNSRSAMAQQEIPDQRSDLSDDYVILSLRPVIG